MKIYLLAQGQGSRWKADHNRNMRIELPSEYKQLVPMGNGEVLIQRTIRQVAEAMNRTVQRTVPDITLVAPGDFLLYNIPDWVKFRSFREPTGCILEGICQTRNEWEGHRVVFLLGDVVYSNNMMQVIISNRDTVSFFGRKGANIFTGKKAGEIFAFSFMGCNETQTSIWQQMRKLWFHNNSRNAKLWTLYNFSGIPIPVVELDKDYTDDIDSPEEYYFFFEKLKEEVLLDDER